MLSIQRREELKDIVLEKKSVMVSDMAKHFNVSAETIRRDFDVLSKEGFLIKSYGGATVNSRVITTTTQRTLKKLFQKEKNRIAEKALEFISPNDCIFLDHSTTVEALCEKIKDMPLVVVTNSLQVVNALSEQRNIKLICTGGVLNMQEQAFVGPETVSYLQNHFVDKAFLSCRMVDTARGATDSDEQVSEVRRNIVENAAKSYLLADHTKIGGSAYVSSFNLNKIDHIISDIEWNAEWRELLDGMGVQYHSC